MPHDTRKLAVVAALLTGFAALPSAAQVVTAGVGIDPRYDVASPPARASTQAIDATPTERIFGDWDGLCTALWQNGINLKIDSVSEFATNVRGGTRRGGTFANQIGLQNDINWERLAGMIGFSTHVIMVNRSGSSDSALFGDDISPVQEVYGSGGDVAVHLVSAYVEETLQDGRFDFAAGRMNVEHDFASSPLYCNFMNNGLCGDPKALPGGDIGHSAYPDAVWGGRVLVHSLRDWSVTIGAYEVNQGLYSNAYYRSGFRFDSAQDSGVYIPIEFQWAPVLGADRLSGHYKIGVGYDNTHDYESWNNALAAAGVPGYTRSDHRGNTQMWILFDQMLLRHGQAKDSGLIALAGFIDNDPNNTAYAQQYYAGLVDHGFWKRRPEDAIGLLFIHYAISSGLARTQLLELNATLPLTNHATGVQRSEDVIEANYDVYLASGASIEPDVQFVVHPNAQSNIRDAVVLGLKGHIEF